MSASKSRSQKGHNNITYIDSEDDDADDHHLNGQRLMATRKQATLQRVQQHEDRSESEEESERTLNPVILHHEDAVFHSNFSTKEQSPSSSSSRRSVIHPAESLQRTSGTMESGNASHPFHAPLTKPPPLGVRPVLSRLHGSQRPRRIAVHFSG